MMRARLLFDLRAGSEVLRVSLPLMLGMAGNLVMLLVDRICLARYSPDTLRASGPAVFTATTVITLITGVVGITRSYVAQAHGRGDRRAELDEGANGVVLALVLAVVLLAIAPLLSRVPELSGEPTNIVALEADFLNWSTRFGAVMAVNMAFASYFNGRSRTKATMIIGIVGQVVGVVMTPSLVFGLFGLPALGMRGSALGTLCASTAMCLGYLLVVPKALLRRVVGIVADAGTSATIAGLWLRLRRGAPSGAALGLDELGQTAFVWLATVLGSVALAANNVALSLNLVAVIPLIGLGQGCNILCGKAVGAGRYDTVPHLIRVSLTVCAGYLLLVSFLQIVTPRLLLAPFGLGGAGAATVASAVTTARVLWVYSLAFMFSVVGSSVLDCFGLARYAFFSRVVLMWGLTIPAIAVIVATHQGSTGLLPVIWVLYSICEAAVAVLCFRRIRRAVASRENRLGATTEVRRA